MSAQQSQYYSFLERERKRALYHQSLVQHNIAVIKQWIATHGDPRQNPDIETEMWLLIDEFGKEIFQAELHKIGLTIEDDTIVDFHN